MKKKLFFCVCILLCMLICASAVPFSAFTYDCPVEVTSKAALVANLDTDTFVYEKNANTARYWSYLSNIMTFLVVMDKVDDLDTRVPIEQSVLNYVDDSEAVTTMDIYVGKKLTVRDLLHFIMLMDAPDAAFVLADYVSGGDIDAFVALMNSKAKELGCKKTKFSSPACVKNPTQYTTCSDIYKVVKYALTIDEFKEISETTSYIPEGYKSKKLAIGNTNSLIKENSPYYFKYIKYGKYGADSVARGNVVAVSEYNDVTYMCVISGAQVENEHNAFTETRQLLSWAYTTLGNKQIVSKTDVLATVTAKTAWGESDIELITGEDIVRTMPGDFDVSTLTYKLPKTTQVQLPVFEGQSMGSAKVHFNGKFFEEIELVASTSQGVSMLSDLSDFAINMFETTLVSNDSDENTEEGQ